jgi:hypothetical protein
MLFFSILTEVFLGSFGVVVPITGLVIYYISITRNKVLALILAVTTGIVVDALFCRIITLSPWINVSIFLFSRYWNKNKDHLRSLTLQLPSGVVVACLSTIPFIINNNLQFGLSLNSFFSSISHLLITLLLSTLFLPAIILILDFIHDIFNEPLFTKLPKRRS